MRDLRKDPRYQNIRRPTAEEAEVLRQRSAAALPVLRDLATSIASGAEPPYETGMKMWETAMGAVGPKGPEGAQCHGLWLLWGALTDWVQLHSDERDAAERVMRRAAGEWLEVPDEEAAIDAYFARWLQSELPQERARMKRP
jgi:hypothetical protein